VGIGIAAVVLALAGCGGAMRPEELARSVDTLASTAAEGQLLARDVARNRTKATFARVHARELADVADHEAEKLADATPREGIGAEQARAVDLADEIGQALGGIRVSPGDETAGKIAARQLEKLAGRAKRLSESL
jgi:outer membrane murein-binding lipoprotein Lpp